MTGDDVKAANEALVESMLRQLRGSVSVGDEMTLDHACLIDDVEAWIAGEPARIAAAVAAAREEQRASDAEHLARIWYGLPDAGRADHGPVAVVRATPLTATPLADEIAALRARVAELEASTFGPTWRFRAEKAEAECDALRAQVEAARQHAQKTISLAKSNHATEELRSWPDWMWDAFAAEAKDTLAAMDEAKP